MDMRRRMMVVGDECSGVRWSHGRSGRGVGDVDDGGEERRDWMLEEGNGRYTGIGGGRAGY